MKPPFTLSPTLWKPQVSAIERVMAEVIAGHSVVLQSPTGSGKTMMASELLRWAERELGGGCFYVNRKLLVEQTAKRFEGQGMHFGVRAADHDEMFDPYAPTQICSADTERSRVYGDKPLWKRHDCGIVIVDEAHIQKGETMKRIVADHRANGAGVVFLSATPVGLGKTTDRLVVAGSMREFRECGALVPAVFKTIEQPDMSKVKRTPSGEFDLGERKRKIYTQTIVGNVIKYWREYNPDARPAMLYAPGKAESVWFTEQFINAGVSWCHVDATEAFFSPSPGSPGKRHTLTRSLWQDILAKYTDGTFKGVSSRFKLREGIDVTSTYQIILATPIGSIQSFLQTVGRGLRSSPDASYHKDHCLVTDHGGNYWRHGSPNHDRDWNLLWNMSTSVASKMHEDMIRNGEKTEPIRCPRCKMERVGGIKCPNSACGFEHPKSQREVIMDDGAIVTKDGDLVVKKRKLVRADTQRHWDDMYFGYKRKGLKKSFSQMEAFFVQQHGYWPDRVLNNMPLEPANWYRHVKDVPLADLRSTMQKERSR